MRSVRQNTALALATSLMIASPLWAEVQVSHGISVFGDLTYPADFKHLAYVNPEAPKGGEISVWSFGGFDSLNPYSIAGRAGGFASIVFESLLEGVADEAGAQYCLICETLEYPPGREWVIFNLRPEAKFSDGTPITAEDVAFSYQTFLTKGLSDFRTVLAQQVEGVEVLGPLRVKFTFKPGFPTRDLPMTVGGLPVLSKADFETNNRDLEKSSDKPFIGSGPYLIDRVDMGRTMTVKRNLDYWGKDLPLNQGRHNFDQLRLEYYADYAAAFEGFKAGNYTFRDEASAATWATGYDFPAVKSGHVKRAELPSGNKASGQAFILNLRREKFQDPRVREAIGIMFNFEWSNETLFYGLYERVTSFWENSDLAARGTPSEAEQEILRPLVTEGLLPADILTAEAVVPAVWGDRRADRANQRRAGELLDAAGWTLGTDQLRRNAAGQTLRVEILNDSQTFDRVYIPYIENMRKVGIDAVMVKIDNSQMEARERPPTYDFDMVTGGVMTGLFPGSELKQVFGSETADMSYFNKMGLKSPAVDRLVDLLLAATTREEMQVRTQALDRVLRSMQLWIPQWYKAVHTVAYYDQYGHPETLPPFGRGELDFWWYDETKAAALRAAGALR